VATVAQADRTYDRAFEAKANCKPDIERRLRTALSSAHEVPERERLTTPIEHANLGGRESSATQLGLDLTNKG
jgi:hypothetical protein